MAGGTPAHGGALRRRSVVDVHGERGRGRDALEGEMEREAPRRLQMRRDGLGKLLRGRGSSAASVECCMHSTEHLRGAGRKRQAGEMGLAACWAGGGRVGPEATVPFSFISTVFVFLLFVLPQI